MSKFHFKIPSEDLMRKKLDEWEIGHDITSEKTPFLITKNKKTGKDVIKARAMAYVVDLPCHLLKALDLIEK